METAKPSACFTTRVEGLPFGIALDEKARVAVPAALEAYGHGAKVGR